MSMTFLQIVGILVRSHKIETMGEKAMLSILRVFAFSACVCLVFDSAHAVSQNQWRCSVYKNGAFYAASILVSAENPIPKSGCRNFEENFMGDRWRGNFCSDGSAKVQKFKEGTWRKPKGVHTAKCGEWENGAGSN